MALRALVPLVRRLPLGEAASDDGRRCAVLGEGLVLIVADRDAGPGRSTQTAWAAPGHAGIVSRSRTTDRSAMLLAARGLAGLDVETIARVAQNATPQDRWLATAERAMVERSAEPSVELACHWVLKEAYGKALGVGLALRLDALTFGGRRAAIVLEGAAAPAREERWTFGLYRHADAVFAIAWRPGRQAGTPLAPAGRKPPTPLPDR